MRCWVCGAPAEGVCRFCAFLFEAWEEAEGLRGLAVEDALHCGVCKVKPDPTDLEFLRRARRDDSSA